MHICLYIYMNFHVCGHTHVYAQVNVSTHVLGAKVDIVKASSVTFILLIEPLQITTLQAVYKEGLQG